MGHNAQPFISNHQWIWWVDFFMRILSKPSSVLWDFTKFCYMDIPIGSISFYQWLQCLVNFLDPSIRQRSAATSPNPQPSLTTASLETRFPFREARWRTLVVLPCHLARPRPRRRTCPGLQKSGNQKGVTVGWRPTGNTVSIGKKKRRSPKMEELLYRRMSPKKVTPW